MLCLVLHLAVFLCLMLTFTHFHLFKQTVNKNTLLIC